MKMCKKCYVLKDIDEFSIEKKNKNGYSGECKTCKKERCRLYREKNKDNMRGYRKEYGQKNKKKIAAKNTLYRRKNTAKIKANNEIWREKNKKDIADKARKRYDNNKEEILAYSKLYRDSNKELIKLYQASDSGKEVKRRRSVKREMRIRETRDGSITPETLKVLFSKQNGRCYMCNCDLTRLESRKVHVDHIKPLSKGGKHRLKNVAWSCMGCNLKKGANYCESEIVFK